MGVGAELGIKYRKNDPFQSTLRIPDLFSFFLFLHPTMKDPGLNLEATNRYAETLYHSLLYDQLIDIIDRLINRSFDKHTIEEL
jgi:hypothetical protein